MELVPGREPGGRSVENIKSMASEAFADGRISAVSITDNPGGNPALSPDVIGHDIFKVGMDVIVHFTCRDANRIGMESRLLQLAMMGMKNILALTGDYIGRGFAGQGAPVFDLDSVTLLIMLRMLEKRIQQDSDPDIFFAGCAVSPFKSRSGEAFAQYAKLCRKVAAGARFAITQLGYDAAQFEELLATERMLGISLPTLGTVYYLNPASARILNAGQVPGATVSDELLGTIVWEWQDKNRGKALAIERAARLGAVLKGLGYRGVHIAGVHRRFEIVRQILDRMDQIENQWKDFLKDFSADKKGYSSQKREGRPLTIRPRRDGISSADRMHFSLLKAIHRRFFNFDGPWAKPLHAVAQMMDKKAAGKFLVHLLEDPAKFLLLNCKRCGDCGIQHVAFLCPESQCPKHIRNGACGGSRDGFCEVFPDRKCVWFRAWERLSEARELDQMAISCIPPRMWELDGTSSWLNFHLKRDHQSASGAVLEICRTSECFTLPKTPMKAAH
jgi:methylenetetrahydrofolate reductase (NADPH)